MISVSEKLRRLSEMSLPEIRFRAAKKLRVAREQLQLVWDGRPRDNSWWEFWDAGKIAHPTLRSALEAGNYSLASDLLPEYFAKRMHPTFYWDHPQRADIVNAYRREFADIAEQLRIKSEALCAHRFRIFAYPEVSCGAPVPWRRDLVHGSQSGLAHYERVRYLNFDEVGDSKVVWEPNRHQQFLTLCRSFLLENEERYAEQCLLQWEHWMAENPYLRGINWSSSLEVAFRSWSWLWLLWLLSGSRTLNGDRLGRITAGLALHASFIANNLSTYFSPNTHLLGEGFALFTIGLLLPELTGSEAWRELGRKILVEQMSKQVREDGSHVEQSTYYHAYATEFFLYAAILADRNVCSFPQEYRDRLEKMLEYLAHTAWPSGAHPSLGDSDGGRLLPLDRVEPNDHRPILSTGTIYFQRGDFRKAAGRYHEQTLWLFGPKSVSESAALKADSPAQPSRTFPDAGLVTMRSDWSGRGKFLVFDAGPQGMGTCAHGHADALSIVCSADGVDWLIDPGTYVYTASRAWRNSFRSTKAHNTVVVDDLDQAHSVDWFKWRQLPHVRLERSFLYPGLDYAVASHDGYARLAEPVFHKRRIVFVKPDYWLISDELTGKGEHQLKFYFHFAPGVSLQAAGQGWLASKGQERLQLLGFPAECSFRVSVGEESPMQGWYSKDYGHREPAPVLMAEVTAKVPFHAHWLLVPGTKNKACLREMPSNHAVLAIETAQKNDFLIAKESEGGGGEFSSDAEFALVRQSKTNGDIERVCLINGSRIRQQDEEILTASHKFAYFSAEQVGGLLDIQAEPMRPFRLSRATIATAGVNRRNASVQISGQEMFFGESN